jgi:signal transduction histidine kinase
MPTEQGLPDVLRARRDVILERWRRRVAKTVEGRDVSHIELLDHMPAFLDELADALDRHVGRGGPGATAMAPEHGLQRLRVGFDVHQVVREYGILADVLLITAEEGGVVLGAADARVLNDELNRAAAEAVRAYVARRDEEARRQAARHRSFIAHELRTPLGSAFTAHEHLRRTVAELDGAPAGQVLGRSLRRLRELIDQVLIEGRLDAGVDPDYQDVDVAALCRQVVEDARLDAEGRGVTVHVDAPAALPARADRRLLHSAVSNLVRNGIKFSVDGGTVTVRVHVERDDAVIAVDDACGGFDPTGWVDVFEPFVQGDGDRTGFGLGLAIAKQAADVHGGRIGFRDAAPRGCTFELRVPCAPPSRASRDGQ